MHEMQTFMADVPVACLSVCLAACKTRLNSAKFTERVEVLFRVENPVVPEESSLQTERRSVQ